MAIEMINNSYSNITSSSNEINTNNNQSATANNQSVKTINNGQDIMEKVKEDPSYLPTVAEKTVINAIENANKKLMGVRAEFEFSVHKQTKQIIIKVINQETKEVIKEIPPEKTLDMVAKMWELSGILVDEKR